MILSGLGSNEKAEKQCYVSLIHPLIHSTSKWLERARDYTDVEDIVLRKIDRPPALTQLTA